MNIIEYKGKTDAEEKELLVTRVVDGSSVIAGEVLWVSEPMDKARAMTGTDCHILMEQWFNGLSYQQQLGILPWRYE